MYDASPAGTRSRARRRARRACALSAFRRLERLPGAAHPGRLPACGSPAAAASEHAGLVAHDELDWAPLGLGAGAFLNLMTARLEPVADELADLAARRIEAGEWPWSFFCYPEERPRPVFPSAFSPARARDGARLGRRRGALPGLLDASRSTSCPHEHVDLPFHNDAAVGVVEHVFRGRRERTVEEFAPSSTRPRSTRAGSSSVPQALGPALPGGIDAALAPRRYERQTCAPPSTARHEPSLGSSRPRGHCAAARGGGRGRRSRADSPRLPSGTRSGPISCGFLLLRPGVTRARSPRRSPDAAGHSSP